MKTHKNMDLVDRVEACIQIFGRSVYGETRIYVADETQANAIRKITTTKTLTTIQMRGLEELGFEFQEVIDPKSRIV